jgi:hypothetical protein
MRTSKLLTVALAFTFAIAAQANAASMVAGWDFSQYLGPAFLSTDGATLATTLSANYSDLDPNGLGTESAAYGTMYIDGTNGSHASTGGADPFIPTGNNLVSNEDAPGVAPPFNSGGAYNVLCTAEASQSFCNDLSMLANAVATPVFQADLGALTADAWELSFGGQTLSGTSGVGIEVSTDGTNYSTVSTETLTSVDTQFVVPLGAILDGEDEVFVRLNFDPTGLDQPVIDNLAISGEVIPEPGTAMLMLLGLVGLHTMGRRRA